MSTPKPPQPSWLLTISSVLTIVTAAIVAGSSSPSLLSSNVLDIAGGLFVLFVLLSFVFLQSRGLFHRHLDSAEFAGGMLLAASVLVGYILCIAVYTCITDWNSNSLSKLLSIGPSALFLGLVFLFISWLNFKWAKTLKAYYADTRTKPPRFRFTTRELLGAMFVFALILCTGTISYDSYIPPHALHASRDEVPFHLPQNATDIAYCEGRKGIAYEFTTDEKSFRDWVNTEIIDSDAKLVGIKLQPINQPTEILRYHDFSHFLDGPSEEITKGLVYDYDLYDPIKAVYDRDTSRAYYSRGYPTSYR